FALEAKPTHAEGSVTGHDRHSEQYGERAERIERTAGKRVAIDVHTLYQAPDHHALGQTGDEGACGEDDIPPSPRRPAAVATLERYAPQSDRDQHDDDRDIQSGSEEAVRAVESREQHHARHDQPRFVAIPC